MIDLLNWALLLGSGKFETPFERMQRAKSSAWLTGVDAGDVVTAPP